MESLSRDAAIAAPVDAAAWLPPPSPLDMPVQSLRTGRLSQRPRPSVPSRMVWRRACVIGTTAVLTLAAVSLLVVIRTARPFVLWKLLLVLAMGALLMVAIVTPAGRRFFELVLPDAETIWIVAGLVAVAGWLLVLAAVLLRRFAPD